MRRRLTQSTFGALALCAAFGVTGSSALAALPADLCIAAKLSVASKYAACRLKADANAAKKGTVADYSKCVAAYQAKWQAAEAKYGGACPALGDEANVQSRIDRSAVLATNTVEGSKIVFVTSTFELTANLTGLVGADATCQALATGAGLFGTYKAWLSDASSGPNTRFTHSTFPYVRTDGQLVANDWTDLTDGTIANAIRIDESGVDQGNTWFAWTNTTIAGAPRNLTNSPAADSCSNWTDSTNAGAGLIGGIGYASSLWTQYSAIPYPCGLNLALKMRLYCFQQ